MKRDLELARRQMILAIQAKRRVIGIPPDHPNRWHPGTVTGPSGLPFTTHSAWLFILQLLESGFPITYLALDQPPGADGYVLMVDLSTNPVVPLYIKLEFSGYAVIGRSFHWSTIPGSRGMRPAGL